MQMTRSKPPLTPQEVAEKDRLNALYLASKPRWKEAHGKNLTQELLGQLVGEMLNEKPMTQGAICQYLKAESSTKLNPQVVQAIAAICDFEPSEVSQRFEPKNWLKADEEKVGLRELSEEEGLAVVGGGGQSLASKQALYVAELFMKIAREKA